MDASDTIAAALAAGATVVGLLPVPAGVDARPLLPLLDRAERERATCFVRADDGACYVAAHALLAAMIDRALGAGESWRLLTGSNGAPLVESARGPLHVSLSHTRGAVAVALSRRAAVGVDVEARRALREGARVIPATMSAREQAALAAADAQSFYRLWTRKEALLKALGLGFSVDPTEFDVLDADAPRIPAAYPGDVTLLDLACAETVAAAVCVRSLRAPLVLAGTTLDALVAYAVGRRPRPAW